MLERDFQQAVVELARHGGWRVHHTRTVRIQGGGWTSPGIDKGFPDLVLVHPKKGVIFAELKTEAGKVSSEQRDWIDDIIAAGGEAYVWRPAQMSMIAGRLCPHPTHVRRIM